ncbi:MAG TPA: serine hydrolase [Blastocatellia bacterium]|nr:serine hydrolase [Blastocatellia bacterium]
MRLWRQLLAARLLALILIAGSFSAAAAQSPKPEVKDPATAIDELLRKTFNANDPGATVIVVKDGKVIHRKGYGLANVELGVPIEPDMIFRLGSITKQFTAVAILMLEEQGKLSVSDDITKYLPDYPVQGRKITIEHLLTHTSGIKSYTSIPEWRPLWRKDVSLKELIDLFKDKPFDFEPGERWSYNNSGYVLLGAIIEKVSGQSYQDFIEKNIFAPLGMKHSFYDDTYRIIPRRVAGYSRGKDGYVNAQYLSMSWPHAAGSLISSVDDLALWDAALYTDKIVKQESLKRAWTPYVLKGGKSTKYGFGWAMLSLEGHRVIQHGGGINGFTTDAVRLPDDRVFVAILTNRDTGTAGLGHKIAMLAVGKSISDPVPIKLQPEALDKYTGVYKLDEKQDVIVTRENDKLFMQHPLAGRVEIVPTSETDFFVKPSPSIRVGFVKNASGGIARLTVKTNIAPDDEATKTDKPIPAPKEAAKVDPAIYDGYVGEYEIAPGFTLTITREGDKLIGQPTGQSKLELFPETKTKFFVKVAPVQIEFDVDSAGKATGLTLYQGGQKMPAKRIK